MKKNTWIDKQLEAYFKGELKRFHIELGFLKAHNFKKMCGKHY